MKKFAALAATLLTLALASPTLADETIKVGRLSCDVEPGIGLVIGSRKEMTCRFHPDQGKAETYHGEITKVGLDIGITRRTHIEWLVFAAARDNYRRGALRGTYVGASGEATLGVGLGANLLVGGSDRSFMLQPWSVQAQTGLNLAVGIAGLTLR